MDVWDTVKERRQVGPNVKTIVSGGYASDSDMANYLNKGFLHKPFTTDALYLEVGEILDS